MEFSMDNFDFPEHYKDYIMQKQRKIELISQITKDNYQEIQQQLLPYFSTAARDVTDFCELFIGISKRKPNYLYHYMWVLCQLLQTAPAANRPNAQDVFDSSTDIFSYFVRFGIFTPTDYRDTFDSISFHGSTEVMRSLIIVSNVFEKQEILNLFFSSNSTTTHHHMSLSRASWGVMGSQTPTFQFNFRPEEEDQQEFKSDDFIEIITNNIDSVMSILECRCKTNSILTALINDDIDWFTRHVTDSDPLIGRHRFEFLNYYYGILPSSHILLVAGQFGASKILSHLLSKCKPDHQLIRLAVTVAINGDLENVKLISTKVPLPSFVFLHSLPTTNLKVLEFLADNCLGKRLLFNSALVVPEYRYPYPPLSAAFLIQKIPVPVTYFQNFGYDTMTEDMLTLFLLYQGTVSVNNNEISYIIDYLLKQGRDDIILAFIKRTQFKFNWTKMIGKMDVGNIDALLRIVKQAYGQIPIKQLVKAFLLFLKFHINLAITPLIDIGGIEFLEYMIPSLGISVLNTIALHCDPTSMRACINIPGIDINNSKHPDQAAPIHFAASRTDEMMVEVLIQVPGIDLNRYDGYNRTPLDIARSPPVAVLLYNHGARYGTRERKDLFNERDFVRSNALMFKSTVYGPLDNFTNTTRTPPFGRANIWIPDKRSPDESKVVILLTNWPAAPGLFMKTRNRAQFGTMSKPLPNGPYGFGDMCPVHTKNRQLNREFFGYGTIGYQKIPRQEKHDNDN